MSKKVIIIGAGLSGLTSAALLAQKGFSVTVLEKQSIPGGVARNINLEGYTFDMGPTWYLMPEIYEDFFSKFGKKTTDFYELEHLEPSYKIWFENQSHCLIHHDAEKNYRLFDSFEENGGKKLNEFLENSAMKYNIAVNDFIHKDFRHIFQLMSPKTIIQGLKLNVFSKLDNFVGKYFSDHRCKKILTFNTVFLGSSPYKTPALYSLMAHADFTQGVFFPKGGIYQLVSAIHKIGEKEGVEFQFNTTAQKIIVNDNKTTGVQSDKGFYPADVVLSSADYHHSETKLLEKKYRNYSDKTWNRHIMAPSTFILFLGVKKKLPAMIHHNFYFAENWKEHFTSIFDKPAWPDNPSYYVGVPSRTDPRMAPENCESLFILVPVAPGLDDNDEIRKQFADKILSHFENLLGENIKDHIQVKKIISHRDFIENNHIFKGASLGLSHTLFQTAFLRPSHWNKKLANLYYVGHHTQPGIGMPMQIIGGKMVAEHIINEHGQ
ncbi:MAG: phytoene desaturase [Spirochaetales bacterium]|nr:phytoene desaturase [Spirochaetales bacterium]